MDRQEKFRYRYCSLLGRPLRNSSAESYEAAESYRPFVRFVEDRYILSECLAETVGIVEKRSVSSMIGGSVGSMPNGNQIFRKDRLVAQCTDS